MPRKKTESPELRRAKLRAYQAAHREREALRETAAAEAMAALGDMALNPGNDLTQNRHTEIDEATAIRILSDLIVSGAAGQKTGDWLARILEFRAMAGAALGPPKPESEDQTIERFIRLFHSAPPALLARAFAAWEALQAPEIQPQATEGTNSDPEAGPAPENPMD